MDRSNYNPGRGAGAGAGRGRGGFGGRGGGVGGGNGGDGRGRGGNYPHQQQYHLQQGQNQGGGAGRGRGGNWHPNQAANNPPPAHRSGYRPTQEQVRAYRPPSSVQTSGSTRPESGESYGRSTGVRAWGPPATQRNWGPTRPSDYTLSQTQRGLPDVESLKVSELQSQEVMGKRSLPVKRPDRGGSSAVRLVGLLVNHFPVTFNPGNTILHYDVEIKQEKLSSSPFGKKSIRKSDMRLIREKLGSDDPRFPLQQTAYDGEKNIFSAVPLPTGTFKVDLPRGEDAKGGSYIFTIKFVNEVMLSKLRDYLQGNLTSIPRDVLQGMDLVMKENPSRHMISIGRAMFSTEFRREDDLRCGVAAFRGFQQSLKPTYQGLAMCLDTTVLAFRKRMRVIDFLREHIRGFRGANDIWNLKRQIIYALKGLKVTVIHRVTKQKYTIAKLSEQATRDISFLLEDPEGKVQPREVMLVSYFREKWGKEIENLDIPCLDVGKRNRANYIPMEFCILAEDKRYPKEQLDREAGKLLKNISLVPPNERKRRICEMVQEEYGPHGGEITRNFEFDVGTEMTRVLSRVIVPPNLRLGSSSGKLSTTTVDKDKCHWNFVGKSVVDGKPAERWALIDFSSAERYNRLVPDFFINKLINRCKNLGVRMEEPLAVHFSDMKVMDDISRLRQLLESIIEEASRKGKGRLQIIVCVMPRKDEGYKRLKWVSEIQVGILTQCCLSDFANKGKDQDLANLGLKINAKLGGSNAELNERPRLFEGEDHVMLIGADVNHPSPLNATSPSIAAVVATVNWPALNRYAARVCPQEHRKEKIVNFGSMCLDLVNTYARLNNVKPKKIVVFRDGVSEGQFDMVLNEELNDLKRAIYKEHYQPTITLVVAQKRHQTRLFLENENQGIHPGNVPPGTVVDTTITHPFEFDFYLCSHFGGLGTSKPTHYYVLRDEHRFTSDQLQKFTFDLCFTYARCSKPVSLAPPVYYADLVAYRGRMYQEVAMELHSPASASSSTSMTSSSSAAPFNEELYKLHPDIQNSMFFV